ncbi:hypothetical protein BJY04DRAFT_197723 [Aspergillus karnatakaensis]|uniref:uncharacterized protein n=1 Tax=Aspergillus karnatakaensis TaxID=1810916 RepID=UPI003CCD9C9A
MQQYDWLREQHELNQKFRLSFVSLLFPLHLIIPHTNYHSGQQAYVSVFNPGPLLSASRRSYGVCPFISHAYMNLIHTYFLSVIIIWFDSLLRYHLFVYYLCFFTAVRLRHHGSTKTYSMG